MPTASSATPDLEALLAAYVAACNAPSFPITASFLAPNALSLYRTQFCASTRTEILQGLAMTFVCMAEPYHPFLTVQSTTRLAPVGPRDDADDADVKGLQVDFSYHAPGGSEQDLGGRRGSMRFWWKRDPAADGGYWRIILEHADDCGFEMKSQDWSEEYKTFVQAQKDKGNWF